MTTTYDLIVLADAKASLNIETSDTSADAELAIVISAVSQRLDDLCGPVVNRTFTDEAYDGGDSYIVLRHASAVDINATTTVTAVKEYDTGGALTTLTAETVTSKPDSAFLMSVAEGARNVLLRRAGGADAVFQPGRSNILVTYTFGRAAATASVPERFQEAARICVNHIWVNLGAQSGAGRTVGVDGQFFSTPAWAIPKAALDLVRDSVRQPGLG